MLEAQGLKKSFGDVKAVDDVSFNIEHGQIMGLVGQNGSGKTTTFRLILKLLTQDEGTVRWNGEKFSKEFFNHVGYLPE